MVRRVTPLAPSNDLERITALFNARFDAALARLALAKARKDARLDAFLGIRADPVLDARRLRRQNFKSRKDLPMSRWLKALPTISIDEHDGVVSDLQATITGYDEHRKDLLQQIDELRKRNAALAAEVQRLQHERDVAKRAVEERASVEQSLRAQLAEAGQDFDRVSEELASVREDHGELRFAVNELALAFAEARLDARAVSSSSPRRAAG